MIPTRAKLIFPRILSDMSEIPGYLCCPADTIRQQQWCDKYVSNQDDDWCKYNRADEDLCRINDMTR